MYCFVTLKYLQVLHTYPKWVKKTAEILLKIINNESIDSLDKTHIIEGKIIIRDSSRKNNIN